MSARRFDAHCHLFDLDYLVREVGNMLWDEVRGRYPRVRETRRASSVRRFFKWLKQVAAAFHGPEDANLSTVLDAARGVWGQDEPVSAIALMMDIYYLFDAPLLHRAGGAAPVLPGRGSSPAVGQPGPTAEEPAAEEPAVEELSPQDERTARANLAAVLDEEEVQDDWKRLIFESLDDQGMRSEGIRGLRESWGFRHHREALTRLVARRRGELYPFFAVDPRRPGAVAAVPGLVGKDGPFFGIKLYPRMGYDPRCQALTPLFAWCSETKTPIVTHCGFGGFPPWDNGHGPLGEPDNFRSLFDRWRELRISFAHFGSAGVGWDGQIIQLMRDFEGRVFADLSCFTAPGEPARFRQAHQADWPFLRQYTMLGTDLDVMYLTRVGMTARDYYRQFEAAFSPSELDAMSTVVPAQFLR